MTRMTYLFVFVVGCTVSLLLIIGGCATRASSIVLVFPPGYVGPVWLIEDGASPHIGLKNQEYIIEVPADGVVKVQSLAPFRVAHFSYTRYSNGLPIEEENPGDMSEAVKLRGGSAGSVGADHRMIIVYYLGTYKQYRDFDMVAQIDKKF